MLVVLDVFVSAHHLRNASLGTSGCRDGFFIPVVTDPASKPDHYHETALDNSVVLHQRYALQASGKAGCYSFSCVANSRTMNPSGADGGNLLPPDWFYDPIYRQVIPSISVAVVNEDLR